MECQDNLQFVANVPDCIVCNHLYDTVLNVVKCDLLLSWEVPSKLAGFTRTILADTVIMRPNLMNVGYVFLWLSHASSSVKFEHLSI